MTPDNETVNITFAPPDMWSRQKDTGKTMAEGFMTHGVPIIPVNNNRVQGHMLIKEQLAVREDGKPGLIIFSTCKELIQDLQDIQADERNPNDCAKEPHDITHTVDALRYYCISRQVPATAAGASGTAVEDDDEDEADNGYEEYMCGSGEPTADYIGIGA
jgi:phage terminase large subunit